MQQIEILLIEDNAGDVILTKEAFRDVKMANNINVAVDGEQAIEYLRKQGEFENAVMPDIILLDLNLPKKDGKAVLSEIKNDAALRHIPVVVMTSSNAERDIVSTYNLHANSYIVKPVELDKFIEVVESIEDFWFNVVALPSKS